jgi:hypothetical protein
MQRALFTTVTESAVLYVCAPPVMLQRIAALIDSGTAPISHTAAVARQ